MSFTLALPETAADELRAALALDDESAWACVGRVALDGQLVLGTELRAVPGSAYLERTPTRLRIASPGIMPAFTAAAQDPVAIPIFFHTHPGVAPSPSELDEVVDRELRELALSRTGRGAYASVIIGGTPEAPRVTGRMWRAEDEEFQRLDLLRAAGPRLGVLLADDRAGEEPAPIFDRHVWAFGPDGQRLLGALTIGVVGAGGTGSPTIEMLARLGVGRIVVVDHDTVDETNLTRIHESTAEDIGQLKVNVAAARGQSYGTGTIIEPIPEKALGNDTIRRLAGCDVIFGCTDDHAGRLVLSKLAYYYLVPIIDCGVQVDAVEQQVRGVDSRVTVVAPGTPCLQCRGQVDMALVAAEMMDAEERARQAQEGYVPGLGDHAPAVIPFTTTTAGLAVSELVMRLFSLGADEGSTYLRVSFDDRSIRGGGRKAQPGHYCTDPSHWGQGDTDPPLGIQGIR